MNLEEHCKKDIELFGTDYPSIHKDLDSTMTRVGHPHRKDTHYLEYVIGKYNHGMWSINGVRSAIQHIIDDCGQIMLEIDWKTGNEILEMSK